jgi:hypothetical protein
MSSYTQCVPPFSQFVFGKGYGSGTGRYPSFMPACTDMSGQARGRTVHQRGNMQRTRASDGTRTVGAYGDMVSVVLVRVTEVGAGVAVRGECLNGHDHK